MSSQSTSTSGTHDADVAGGSGVLAPADIESLRSALVAFYGVEVGTEAWADAMVVAWERRHEVASMANPVGFLFRVGQSHARPHLRWVQRRAAFPGTDRLRGSADASLVELIDALKGLRPEQRAAVLMVKAHGFSYLQTAEMLGITEASVTNHVHRGLAHLRRVLSSE